MRPPPDMLIVSLEPAPYKTDLYNALSAACCGRLRVVYIRCRDWDCDGGHDFQALPESRFEEIRFRGQGLFDHILLMVRLVGLYAHRPPEYVIICAYSGFGQVLAILLSILRRVPFALWTDRFAGPQHNPFKRWSRSVIRRIVFRKANAVLMCGRTGVESAWQAGCSPGKTLDFPYVVNSERIDSCASGPESVPVPTSETPPALRIVYSGRMIHRKGLEVLVRALTILKSRCIPFQAILEGDGPNLDDYKQQVSNAGLDKECLFFGFQQMEEHARLLAQADVVVVPSHDDPWGIVVHEAMLLGKPVCASDGVASAVCRIESGRTGLIFPRADSHQLAEDLIRLFDNRALRDSIGEAARKAALHWSPERNVGVLLRHIRETRMRTAL